MTDVTPALLDELERLRVEVASGRLRYRVYAEALEDAAPDLIARLRQLEAIEAAARRLAVRQSGDYQAYQDEQREALADLRATLAAPHDAEGDKP